MRKIVCLIFVIATLAPAFCACANFPAADCISYRADSFTLNGRYECGALEYSLTLAYEKDGALTATVAQPERIAGCAVTLGADGSASLTFGGITATLAEPGGSTEEYGTLAALRDLVLPPADSLISAKVIKLGGQKYNLAVFAGERGNVSVWFDRDGIPVRFEAEGAALSVNAFKKITSE